MNENVLSFIKWGAGTVLTLAIISVIVIVFNSSKDATRESINKLNDMNTQIAESDIIIYDGIKISGSEVVSVIRKYDNKYIAIGVKNLKNKHVWTWYGYNASISGSILSINTKSYNKVSQALDKSSTNTYISPGGNFIGKVLRDENGVIVGITFAQQ